LRAAAIKRSLERYSLFTRRGTTNESAERDRSRLSRALAGSRGLSQQFVDAAGANADALQIAPAIDTERTIKGYPGIRNADRYRYIRGLEAGSRCKSLDPLYEDWGEGR
jgi:hypothetical protein